MRAWLFKTNDIERFDWWSNGIRYRDNVAALAYLVVAMAPLVAFSFCGFGAAWLKHPGLPRLLALAYGAVVSFAPIIWLWVEAAAFFEWSARRYTPKTADDAESKRNELILKEERERFQLHAEHAKALWAGVIALYAGALLKFGPQ